MARRESITWATLLAHFTSLAKASLALPKDASGDRWRAAVPAIVSLQAVTHALWALDAVQELEERRGKKPASRSTRRERRVGVQMMENQERAVSLDKAEILIRRDSQRLRELWEHRTLHPELASLIDDANEAYDAACDTGYQWYVAEKSLVAEHPADLVAALLGAGFAGTLWVPPPGVMLYETCPAVWLKGSGSGEDQAERRAEAGDDPLEDDEIEAMLEAVAEFVPQAGPPRATARPLIGYRQFDFAKGGPVRDVVVELEGEPPGGQALMVSAIDRGEAQPVSLPPRRSGGAGLIEPLPVEYQLSEDDQEDNGVDD